MSDVASAGSPEVTLTAGPILEVKNLSKVFHRRPDALGRLLIRAKAMNAPPKVRAVNDVSLSVAQGKVLGIVGESGCGKSTLGRMIAQILPQSSGSIHFEGRDVAGLGRGDKLAADLSVQMIFQDTMSSLHLRKRAGDLITEAAVHHGLISRRERRDEAVRLLELVGLPAEAANRYPRQFSGGQRQRLGIARALSVKPKVLVCDESVASLDVSIQAQILNLFMELKETLGLTYIFVSHDLGVVRHISDTVAVMYLGRVVEHGPAGDVFDAPRHPYTRALLEELPKISHARREFKTIEGEIPSPLKPPSGCTFHPRCPLVQEACRTVVPPLLTEPSGHQSACHMSKP